jgi:hypothetical protein
MNTVLTLTYNQLSTFAGSDNFWNLFDTTFGTQYDHTVAVTLRTQWLSGDFSQLPQVEILDNSTLGNANGAYATSTNKIYLSANFIATSTPESISAVLLEEIGHFIDAQINQIDTPGDEGEKFSALVRGQNLTTQELDRINTENDPANITVDGKIIAVEQAAPIVLTVTTTADQNDGSATGGLSLRDAILIANANTTNDYIIELQGGQTYSLVYSQGGSLDIQGNATIRAVGNEPAIIDGSKLTYTSYNITSGNDIFRVRAQGNLTLDNITVTKATSTAIYIESNASVLIKNSTVSYTSGPFAWAYELPGIENSGTLTLQNSSVHDNAGNGIINYGTGTALIVDSAIYNNEALSGLQNGGGGILNSGSVVLNNSWIYNNQGVLGSGIENNGSFTGINSVIKSNSGSSGILNRGTLDLINTAIVYNSSAFVEGAGLNNSGTANLNNTTISNNTMSGFEGGGIYNHGILNLLNSTIANNTATSGGGIYSLSGGQITLKNTIVAGNNANSEKDIYGSVTGNNNNLIGNLTGASGTVGTGTDIVNPNPGLGTLQYIGNTYIHPLLAGSPAINAGNNSLIPADTQDLDSDQNTTEIIPLDQRNLLRIFGTTVDIGAVELSNGSGTNILPEVEGNNTFATAQVIANTSFNRQVVADIQDLNGSNISTTYDHVSILGTGDGTFDLYRFNSLANTQLVFDIDNNNFDTILRLWNPNNNQLLALNDDGIETGNTGNSTASFLTYKTLTTSDYVIGVYRYSSSALTPPATGDSYTLHLSMLNDAVFTPIESAGNTKLVKDAANKYFTQVGTNTPIAIKNGGQQIYQNIYGSDWQTIAAETVNGVNQVLWKNVAGNYLHLWRLDNNWNLVSSEGQWALNSAEAFTQETNFGIDTNGDGVIGNPYTLIESAGNTKLVKDPTNKYFTQVGTNTPIAIKNGGQQIYQNIYGSDWQTIAAETVNVVNQVLWKNVAGNYLHLWRLDNNWNLVSSEGQWALNSAEAFTQETNFGIDANGDGKIGYVIIEANGNTTFLKDATNKYFTQIGTNTPIAIKNGGQQISQNIYGSDWQTIAAETVNGVNQVLWKNIAGNYLHIWRLDSNWNLVSSEGQFGLNSAEAFTQETNFGIDANGDGVIGNPYTPIESAGNTKLVKDPTNKYFTQVGTNSPIAIKNGGQQISQNIYGSDWQTIAAETVNGNNQVLWKNIAGNYLHLWRLDNNWNWVSSEGNWALNSAEALTQETNFGIDANSDGVIGYTPIELAGNTKLIKDTANKYFTQVGTNPAIAIKNGGQQISQNIYGSDWQTIAAETVNGVNQVLWKNLAGNYLHIWRLDSNWNWVSSEGQLALNSAGALTQETIFGIDANSDGVIGNPSSLTLTGTSGNDFLVGGANNDILTGAGGKDTLIGGLGSDKFVYQNLTDSLLANFDVITDFNATNGNDLFRVSTARAGFIDVGGVNTLDTAGISTKLTAAAFGSNFAAQFSFGQKTFVAINDATAGFNAANDAIIEVTGLTGTLNINNFVIV